MNRCRLLRAGETDADNVESMGGAVFTDIVEVYSNHSHKTRSIRLPSSRFPV